jgi:hypothetical protein
VLVGLEALCLLAATLLVQTIPFLGVIFLVGAAAAAVQLLVPNATNLAGRA